MFFTQNAETIAKMVSIVNNIVHFFIFV